MRRLLRGGALSLLALLAVLTATYAWAWTATDTSQLARTLVWLESDVDDWQRFPSRPVPAGPDVRSLVDAPIPPGVLDVVAVDGRLEPLDALLDRTGTQAFLVLHQDGAGPAEVLVEWYGGGGGPAAIQTSFSAVKAVVSTLIGIAAGRGELTIDDPITRWLPELGDRDPRFETVTIRHLMDMTSGIRYVERGLPWSDDATTYYAPDLRAAALAVEVAEPPGRFHYNNYNLLLEGLILERATGRRVADLLAEQVWQPMGAQADASWSLDSQQSGFEKMESGLNAVARDYARFGLLVLDGGRAMGEQVLPQGWVAAATAVEGTDEATRGYQHHWWVDPATGRFAALGKYWQMVLVDPATRIVVVRLGPEREVVDWRAVGDAVIDRVAAHLAGP